MSVPILAFPAFQEGQSKIPTPIYFQAGDEYTRVNIASEETKELGLYHGAVVIFLRGFRQEYAIHLFTLDGCDHVARLRYRGHKVRIGLDSDSSEWRPARELDIYGAMVELYPGGLDGPRSVIYREDRARILAPRHPERGMEYRLLNVASN